MSVEVAREYFQLADDPDAGPADIAALFAEGAVLYSPREGKFEGRDGVRDFFERNVEFFETGLHHMDHYHVDGPVVVAEGWIEGVTSAGRAYQGIGLVDVMRFNQDDEIEEFRVYLDYSGILSELPEDVPDFRL